MKLSSRPLAALALVTLATSSAYADGSAAKMPAGDVASSSSGGGAVAPQAPHCSIGSNAPSWKIPVNAAVPVTVEESSGAKLTPTVTLSPTAEYTLTADTGSPRPEYYRLLKIPGAKVGDRYDVTLGGTCVGATDTVTPFSLKVEFVAEAQVPVTLGTMAENPQGTTVLTLDPSYLPFQQVSEISFKASGSGIGGYPSGILLSAEDVFGVRACVGGACTVSSSSSPLIRAKLLNLSPALVCTNGRDSGLVEVSLSAQARIPGATTQPSAATGTIHVDCSKATDTELGKGAGTSTNPNTVGTSPGTGCNLGGSGTSGFGGAFAILFALAATRRRTRTSR